jgi:hypothetical protein
VNSDGRPELIVGEKNRVRVLMNQTGHPRITGLIPTAGGMEIQWSAVPGKIYRVQFKSRWDEPEWSDLGGEVAAGAATASLTDEAHPTPARRFYRIIASSCGLDLSVSSHQAGPSRIFTRRPKGEHGVGARKLRVRSAGENAGQTGPRRGGQRSDSLRVRSRH